MHIDGRLLPKNHSLAALWARRGLESGAARVSAFAEVFFELAKAFRDATGPLTSLKMDQYRLRYTNLGLTWPKYRHFKP